MILPFFLPHRENCRPTLPCNNSETTAPDSRPNPLIKTVATDDHDARAPAPRVCTKAPEGDLSFEKARHTCYLLHMLRKKSREVKFFITANGIG